MLPALHRMTQYRRLPPGFEFAGVEKRLVIAGEPEWSEDVSTNRTHPVDDFMSVQTSSSPRHCGQGRNRDMRVAHNLTSTDAGCQPPTFAMFCDLSSAHSTAAVTGRRTPPYHQRHPRSQTVDVNGSGWWNIENALLAWNTVDRNR